MGWWYYSTSILSVFNPNLRGRRGPIHVNLESCISFKTGETPPSVYSWFEGISLQDVRRALTSDYRFIYEHALEGGY